MRYWIGIVFAIGIASGGVLAQDLPRSLFLVARPGMNDPNFRESVVLVTPDDAGGAIGIIINRPTDRSLASILPGDRFSHFTEPVFFGGPVAPNGIVALFRADKNPGDAIRMFPGLFLALTPATIDELLSRPPSTMRLYSGYSGWAPGQVQIEMRIGGWYALDADSQTVFRKDVQNIWQDLVRRALLVHAGDRAPAGEPAAFGSPQRLVKSTMSWR